MKQQQSQIVAQAVFIINTYAALANAMGMHASGSNTDVQRLDQLEHDIRLIGQTAAYFGGFKGMIALNDAIVIAGGDSGTLNELWAHICGWMP